jgi:hypothetical protein
MEKQVNRAQGFTQISDGQNREITVAMGLEEAIHSFFSNHLQKLKHQHEKAFIGIPATSLVFQNKERR